MDTRSRDTLARDLLTLPALVGAPGEVVRGLVLLNKHGQCFAVAYVCTVTGDWQVGAGWSQPATLADAGWRVDLDAPATAGVLEAVLELALGDGVAWVGRAHVDAGHPWMACHWLGEGCEARGLALGDTRAEAAARALMAEVSS